MNTYLFNYSLAQEKTPLVYAVENTGADYPMPTMPAFNKLPTIQSLPDPFKEYSIDQNYPNPFNPNTTIKFALPQRALTKIIIYDLFGKEIQSIINKDMEAGYHEINFDASNFQSGVYFYRIQSGELFQTRK